MAAVDVSRVIALANKAVTLKSRGHWARAAEIYAEAVTAAQALQQPDCIIVAHLQALHADVLLELAEMAGVPEARRIEILRSAFLELLPPAKASLERRMAAGTLMAGACRSYEVAWCAATTAHAEALAAANMPNVPARVPLAAEEMSAWTAYVGYDAYILTAGVALRLCAFGTHAYTAQKLNLPEAAAAACSVLVASAFDTIQLRTEGARMPEAVLVRNAQDFIEENQWFRATSSGGNEWHELILAAWRRLRSSTILQRRGILEQASFNAAAAAHGTATAAATAVARGLLVCALHTCGAQEVHASHFKRCSACLSVVYCCKEHQVQDWPVHKAACRAARKSKAAEQDGDEASGA
jgi:hypothetical protein